MTVSVSTPPPASPVWWSGVWCAVLLLGSEWALSLIEAYASVTGSLASPAWVIPGWLFLTPIGMAATFVLGCWIACLRRPLQRSTGAKDGIRSLKAVPSSRDDVTPIVPPWTPTISRAMKSPSPKLASIPACPPASSGDT